MNFNAKEIIKFLFPEWQIIEAIKKKGFISSPNKNIQSITQHKHKDVTKFSNTSLVNFFDSVRNELGTQIVGQSNYLDNLCIAFKRPFFTGYNGINPKNTMLLIGNKGTGKHYSVSLMAQLLKQRELVSSGTVFKIDLSLYPTAAEFGLFLSDLYQGLYGESDIIVFDYFDKCHPSIVDAIKTLALDGKLKLGSRYIFQNHNLIEATGMLLQNSISQISSNGKYFVFTSEKEEKHFSEAFGSKFMECVRDIIYTDKFNQDDLIKLSLKVMQSLQIESYKNLLLIIHYDNLVTQKIASSFKISLGVTGMYDFSNSHLYKPLAEYALQNDIKPNQNIHLTVHKDEFIARFSNTKIYLSEFLPNKSNLEIEYVKKELEEVIGLDSVKQYILGLENHLKIQKVRENSGYKVAELSMHMIFTGNSGTGKTTVARIVAKYLKALGILSSGQLREVTRGDLVGQYVGQTAKQTNDVIKSALGGVLFIDEAYALCRDKHDIFGLEAIDTLVKGIEDNRNDLVVILAGYQDEMTEFLKSNSGLKSRFPNMINFDDYTSYEMYTISLMIAKTKGYKIAENCKDELIKLFDKKQIKGRNDSGNGRLVRNVVEEAIINQSKRLLIDYSKEMDVLEYDDFKFENMDSFDLEASLSTIIGLNHVKDFVRTQYRLLIAHEKRRKSGVIVDKTQSLNMIFSGNPGTGKTTIARIVATMFQEMGLLKSGHLIDTDRSGLVGQYSGQTAVKTKEIFKSALGGVLFIDEAYALSNDNGSFGKEAIDTLVKLMEDNRGEIVVILAGYKKEMDEFLKTNSGLESRFPLTIDFPDYSLHELFSISKKIIYDKGFILTDAALPILKEQIALLHKKSSVNSGNGRMVRNYIEAVIRRQSTRIAINEVPIDEMNTITPEDIGLVHQQVSNFNLENELSKIVGLDDVKDYVRSLSARIRMQNERKKLGLFVDNTQTLHMIFKGNPGTGKTMMARTIAQFLYNIGVITTNKFVETDRSELVAGYVGQTAIRTKEKVMEAMDGVLFIDEAYSLDQGGTHDFGKEAIDTLVKLIDDYRDRIVVILAGYSEDMEQFLSINPGLKSRFPNITEFSDYTTDQLMKILELLCEGQQYVLDFGAKMKFKDILSEARKDKQLGNGRYVRNLFEKAINNQALRLSKESHLTKETLITITCQDIEKG